MSLRSVRIGAAPVLLVCVFASLPAFAEYGDHYAITDPSYPAQWPLENYGQDWPEGCGADPTDPSDDCRPLLYDADMDWGAAYDAGYTGQGVLIAIGEPLGAPTGDTIRCDHPGLAGRLWVNPEEDINGSGAYEPLPPPDGDLNGIDDDVPPNGFVDDVNGANFMTGDGDVCTWGPGGLYNHDTSTALLAVASQDGYGWVGVAPEAKLMILMGFDDLSAHAVFYDEVIPYAEAAGVRVIYVPYTALGSMLPATPESCSIAGDVVMPNGMTRTEILESSSVVVIWGQPEPSNPDFGNFQYPTCEPAVLGVAQSKETDTNVMTSIFTDLSVPGGRPDRSDVQLSWAIPQAAGALALLFEQDPTLTRAEAIDRLLASADKVGTTPYDAYGRNDDYGYGRLNVFGALELEHPRRHWRRVSVRRPRLRRPHPPRRHRPPPRIPRRRLAPGLDARALQRGRRVGRGSREVPGR
jgi:hypothetical protein